MVKWPQCPNIFLYYLALDVIAAICICEIHWWAQDEFDLKTIHKLNSKEKNAVSEQQTTFFRSWVESWPEWRTGISGSNLRPRSSNPVSSTTTDPRRLSTRFASESPWITFKKVTCWSVFSQPCLSLPSTLMFLSAIKNGCPYHAKCTCYFGLGGWAWNNSFKSTLTSKTFLNQYFFAVLAC